MEIVDRHNRIRTILAVDELDLPTAVIDYPEYTNSAERYVKSKVSNWSDLGEEDRSIFESCILYKTAELLVPYCQATANKVKVSQTTHSKVEYFEASAHEKYAFIRDTLEELIAQITDGDYGFYGFDLS